MIRICFVRHGDAKNDNLTRLGKKQAKDAIKQLEYENIKKIYCSPLNRCIQTATIISKKLGLEIEIIEDLKERTKIRNPKTKEEYEVNENYLNYNYINKNHETCNTYINKSFKAFDYILSDHKGKDDNILIVAHSSTIYALNSYICGIPQDGNINWLRIGNCSKICYEKNL